jgi:hypothetical protein
MIGHSKMNEMLHDMTPNGMLFDVSVSAKKEKIRNKSSSWLIFRLIMFILSKEDKELFSPCSLSVYKSIENVTLYNKVLTRATQSVAYSLA